MTTDLCGEVGIKSEAFQVNTQHFGELDHTHLLLAVLETVCVCVCVCVCALHSVKITEFGSG